MLARGRAWLRSITPFPRGTWRSRVMWVTVFAVPVTVLGIASRLTPTAAHGGTHTQLGLEPCGFYDFTGYPCPGCGMTTAFAHLVRGHLFDAWAVNPFGPMLFFFSLGFMVFAIAGFAKQWAIDDTYQRLEGERWLLGLALVAVAVWIWRVVAIVMER